MAKEEKQKRKFYILHLRRGGRHVGEILNEEFRVRNTEDEVITVNPQTISRIQYEGVLSSYNPNLSKHDIFYGEDEVASGRIMTDPIKFRFKDSENVEKFKPEEIKKIEIHEMMEI